jgi:hypothetical protein
MNAVPDLMPFASTIGGGFFVLELESYTYEQFCGVTMRLLNADHEIGRIIANAVWSTSRNLRDCARIGKLARSEEDVNFQVEQSSL